MRGQKVRGVNKYANDLAELVLTSKQNKLNILKEISSVKKSIADLKIKADAMKTEKGKTNKYIKSYENIQPYFSCLSDRNKEYVSKMLNKK